MNLSVENLREPDIFRVEIGESSVDVHHFSIFDRDTGETESLSLSLSRGNYEKGLQELNSLGSCRISGKHGDLELAVKKDGTLSVSMIGKSKTINLQGLSFRLES